MRAQRWTTIKKKERERRKRAKDEEKKKSFEEQYASMIETTCVSKSVQSRSRGTWPQHKINRNGGKKLWINGVSLDTDEWRGGGNSFSSSTLSMKSVCSIDPPLLSWKMDASIDSFENRDDGLDRVFPVPFPSIRIRVNYLGWSGEGKSRELSVKHHLFYGRCRDNLFTR